MKYKIAVVQMDTTGSEKDNLNKISRAAAEAAAQGAQLVTFPERAEYMGRGMREHACPIPGKVSEHLGSLAKELGIHILCGVGETVDQNVQDAGAELSPYNTCLVFGPDGRILGKYRKLHLFQVEGPGGMSVDEHRFTTAGDQVVTADTGLGRLGLSICYDVRFPELYRRLAMEGAEVLFVPADFTYETGKEHWEILLRARAIENTCYVVAPNQCGQKPRYRAYGNSMIVDPWGRVIARAGEEEAIIYGEIDSEVISDIRQQMPSLNNIRSDIF